MIGFGALENKDAGAGHQRVGPFGEEIAPVSRIGKTRQESGAVVVFEGNVRMIIHSAGIDP